MDMSAPNLDLALAATRKAIKRGWTDYGLAGCTALRAAIQLGFLRKDRRYKVPRYRPTPAGRRAVGALR